MAESEMMTSAIWSAMDDEPEAREYVYDKPDVRPWGQHIARLLFGADLNADDILVWRRSPDWCYYRSAFNGTSVIKSAKLASLVRSHLESAQAILKDGSFIERFEKESRSSPAINEYRPRIRKDSVIPGIAGSLYIRNRLNNFISYRAVERARAVLDGLEGKSDYILAPTEDIFCMVGKQHLLFIPHSGGCGLKAFSKEKQKLWERHRVEAELFSPEAYEWIEPTNPKRFESLIYDLISREPGVMHVRMAGDTRDRDGGRDLLVEWRRPSTPGSVGSEKHLPMQVRRFIVQCKARSRNIGPGDMPEIMDSLYHYHAGGYLLAVSRQVTSSLVDRLDDMRRRRDFDTDWWTRKEIEDRLKRNPDISANYSDLFRRVNLSGAVLRRCLAVK
jgi:hypothetical protein